MATDDRPSRKKKPAKESLLAGARERAKNALITGTAGGYLGGMLIEGKTRVKVPGSLTRKLMGMGKRRKTVGVHGARAGALVGALIGAANRGPRSETADAIATGGDWKFEDGKPTRVQSAGIGAAVPLTAAGLVLGTKGGRNLLRGLLSKVDRQDPRRLRKMGLQQKRKDASIRRAGEKAVAKAREQFRAEAMPKPPKDPTLGDAVKTVAKRTKRKVVKAVSNIGAGDETAFSAYIEDMTFSGLPKDVQKDVLRFVDAQKGTPVVHYGMTVKELIAKADPENLKAARKALGTLRASRAAAEVLGRVKDGSKYILLMNDRIVDGHHFLAKAERGQVTSSLNVLDLTPARLETRLSAGERLLWQFAEGEMTRRNRTRELRDRIGLAKDVAGLGAITAGTVGGVKLYRAAKKGIEKAAPQMKATARAWHRAGSKAARTLDTVKDAVAPAAATNRGVKAVGRKVLQGIKKATMWMHGDPRPVRAFEASPVKRDRLSKVRDAALTAGGLTVAGAGAAAALKAREAGKITDNIRNTTAIGADVGKVYRKARKVVTDSIQAGKEGFQGALNKPAPRWAKRTVRIGKKLRLLDDPRAMNEFALGLLLTGVGTLAGSAAGNKFRYPLQNALKKKLVPKLGTKWGRRVARAGGYLPENAGAIAGGMAGSILGGGIRRKPEEVSMAALGMLLHQFGGREQLKDIDSSGFLDPLDIFVGRRKGYTSEQVKDYNRQRRYIEDVRSKKRKGSAESVQAANDLMKQIRENPSKAAHGQVVRSVLRKGDSVRRAAERGGGLIRDAAKELRGEGREKDRWGREKKREWEKPWFQRTKNQVIGAAALGGGALLLRKNPRLRARVDRVVRVAKRKVNEQLPDFFPDAKPLRRPGQKTVASVHAKQQAAAQAKAAQTQAHVAKAAQNIAQQAAAVKTTAAPKTGRKARSAPPATKQSPAPAPQQKKTPPVLKTAPAPQRQRAASKPPKQAAPKPQVKPAPKPQTPPKNTQPLPGLDPQQAPSPWGASKIANEPKPLTAAEKLAKAKPKGRGKTQLAAALDLLWQFAEKPFAGFNPKRHARTGGLNDSFRKNYNREHGANLKRPVTTKPSKLKAGSEAAGRRKSFCARMGGMPGATSKGGKLTPKGAALRRWNCAARQVLTQFADPLDVGWDLRDARGNSARVFAPHAGQRDRRPKKWHERVENERKLWAAAGLAGTGIGVAATRKLVGKQVNREVKRRMSQVGAAVKKRYVPKSKPKPNNITPFNPEHSTGPFRAA